MAGPGRRWVHCWRWSGRGCWGEADGGRADVWWGRIRWRSERNGKEWISCALCAFHKFAGHSRGCVDSIVSMRRIHVVLNDEDPYVESPKREVMTSSPLPRRGLTFRLTLLCLLAWAACRPAFAGPA